MNSKQMNEGGEQQGQQRHEEQGQRREATGWRSNQTIDQEGGRRMQSWRSSRRGSDTRRHSSGNSHAGLWAILAGIGAGMATMYFMDPERGRRRRALAGDKFTSAGARLPRAARGTAKDMSNRARGMWADATRLFSSDDPSDQVIEARIRSKMGRTISHPHAVHVMSNNGNVILDGMILADEIPALMKCAESVSGVNSVESRLREHESSENIPSLQSSSETETWSEASRTSWSPAARIGAGAVGLGLGAFGATLVARSMSGGGRTAITIDKAINVKAPPDVLYALWANFENFPQFMANVLEVRNIDDNRSHWKVAGPAGIPVEWDAEITKIVPNEMIAWRSVPGSTVENAGYVLFEPNDDGTTEVTVRMSYNPPAGAIGHAVATAFGADPKSEMDEDLMRMKSLLETGKLPDDAAQRPYARRRDDRIH